MVKNEEFGSFPGELIASTAITETLSSYRDNLEYYRELGCSYIPIPSENKYYSVEDGELNDLRCEQKLLKEMHLLTIIDRLTKFPFVLLEDGPEPETQSGVRSSPDGRYQDSEVAIVTVADVNRTPTRQMLSPYILEFKSQLAREVERYRDPKEIPEADISATSLRQCEDANGTEIALPITDYLTLSDYQEVIAGDDVLMAACGFGKEDAFDSTFEHVIELADTVHSRDAPMVESQEDVDLLLRRIRNLHQLKKTLAEE